ncbi:Decapping and exoribonuclease protein [Blattella germanica]|nr:Decapping and exoribonuclease protein [Blattella germanica]
MLMYTPFENIGGWIICATRFKGTLYLCEYRTEEEKEKREQLTDREKHTPNGKPDPLPPVNEREELCLIFTTKLNGMSLLFGAEMDGVLSHTKISDVSGLAQAKFVELKTSRQIESHKQFNNFKRFKLLKWWCQNFLVGVEYLVCGFRNDEGIVQTLEQFHNTWDPNVCMNFCAKFLNFANHLVKEEDPDTVWKFEWKPHERVMANKIKGPSEYSFLPKWYTEAQTKI